MRSVRGRAWRARAADLGRCTSTMLLVVAATALAPSVADAAKRGGGVAKCSVKAAAAGLDVQCPSATVAEFLAALGKATGVQSDYAADVGAHRVSVALRRVTLQQALEKGLDKFNYAVWADEQRPSVSHVSIVGLRQSDGVEPAKDDRQLEVAAVSEPAAAQTRPDKGDRTRARRTGNEDATKQVAAVTPIGPGAPWMPASADIVAAVAKPAGAPAAAQHTERSASLTAAMNPGKPTAVLLMPPTAGATPLLPERVDSAAILRPE